MEKLSFQLEKNGKYWHVEYVESKKIFATGKSKREVITKVISAGRTYDECTIKLINNNGNVILDRIFKKRNISAN
jgi:6-phosphogluconolactonase/glucosamine-6-phosphate isomerase/deaminase